MTYPLSGSPIANGTKLTIVRSLPYTQPTVLTNQGGYYLCTTAHTVEMSMYKATGGRYASLMTRIAELERENANLRSEVKRLKREGDSFT